MAVPLPPREHVTVFFALATFIFSLCRSKSPHLRVLAIAALVIAFPYTSWRVQGEHRVSESRTARFAGVILDERETPDGLFEYRTRLDNGLSSIFSSRSKATVGDRVVVRGRLEPFDGPRNPGEPSQREIERENGIDARIESAAILSRGAAPPSFALKIARIKTWALAQLQLRLGDPAAEILAGELWGERGSLPPDLRNEFQETGTVHILVTAGLHVGLVATLAIALCALLGVPRVHACAFAIACVWAFAVLSGLHIPSIRAATMASTALAARACGRANVSWNALAAAAVVVVAVDPLDVTSVSFWLSFCCVGAIFALASELTRHFEGLPLSARVREAFVLTIATQLGTWPLSAAAFLQFTPYAVLANVAVVPCVPVTMALGAAQLVFSWCSPLAQAF
ncbi:MAG: ComEC/Rec2 family competence protein, partial [Candidatus Baltobacteraceae bacterium]